MSNINHPIKYCIHSKRCSVASSVSKAWFSLDASVSISTSKNTKEKRHVMTFKDKAHFAFEMSFVLAQSYAYACAYVDAYVAHFAGSFCLTFCLDPFAYACV